MALLNNPYIIDIIIGLFLIIYTFIGYLKGFIIRLYDFFSLFIAYFLTINFSFPLSKLITLRTNWYKGKSIVSCCYFIYCWLFHFKGNWCFIKTVFKENYFFIKNDKIIRSFIRFDFINY